MTRDDSIRTAKAGIRAMLADHLEAQLAEERARLASGEFTDPDPQQTADVAEAVRQVVAELREETR